MLTQPKVRAKFVFKGDNSQDRGSNFSLFIIFKEFSKTRFFWGFSFVVSLHSSQQ